MASEELLPITVKKLSFYEERPTRTGSARSIGGAAYPLDYNHIEMCKPANMDADKRYVRLKDFIRQLTVARRIEQPVARKLPARET
ncbi:hypothetical protein JKP88DRAFT_272764 [Tribonema minus]|uniref:Uncharacterized protein n=1 Tax=Tribonema minus TaxID=303371 RepID=A0A835Z6F0_9STRA|nr:hypothetical protein JKP88DRAFT_272764 [Tribonema minus]